MSFAAHIVRTPIAVDPEAGAEAARAFADAPPECREVLVGAAGSSPYLRGLMGREAAWLAEALVADPATIVPSLLAEARALPEAALKPGLRQTKRRLALYVGLADLAGIWPLETVTAALTDFADLAVDRALKAALAPALARGKVPDHGADDVADAAGMCVLAMGKMGAHELNYSSDIDLIVLFDDARFEGSDIGEARSVFVRATKAMAATLSDLTGDGYVWRTDLRLRPDPAVTPVCVAMEAAERYYENLGRTWERAAHIKARPCAGDCAAGDRYLERISPFVWRRHLDFAAIEDAHDMRQKIRDHRGLHEAVTLEGRDLKLGHGGIREIEFFTQTLQLIGGGRDPRLRIRATRPALGVLSETGWVPAATADRLSTHYRRLREVEHRVQMIADARTHALPAAAEGFDRLSRLSGIADTDAFRAEMADLMEDVSAHTHRFFARDNGGMGAGPDAELPDPEIVGRWRHYPALRSERAQAIFRRLKPDLLARLRAADRPEEALAAFDGFLAGLPAGVQLFAMFEANPQLRALIVDIAATAPALANYLSRHSRVLEAVVTGQLFTAWPGRDALRDALVRHLAEIDDYERQLDAARRWAKEWHFRIGVHHLRGIADAADAGRQYADLAAATLSGLLPAVAAQFAAKHGDAPGQGLAVLAMGSLGAGWLTAGSDLDLIVVYDPNGVESSDGPRPLATRPYYARLTQALVTALSAPTAEGKLYEVDMRLRPSGRKGPVATSLAAFAAYQRDEAWTWEHLAMTRARAIAGSADVCAAVEAVRREVLAAPRDPETLWADLARMRARLAEAKPPVGPLDVKPGPGGLQDIELFGQAAALATRATARRPAKQLKAALGAGRIDADGIARLAETHRFARAVQSAGRLVLDGPLTADRLGDGAARVLLRETGQESVATLSAELTERRAEAAALIDQAVGAASADGAGTAT